MKYSPEEIRHAAAVLYSMPPGTPESAAAYEQMLEWADRIDPISPGHAAYIAAGGKKQWSELQRADRFKWASVADAVVNFNGRSDDDRCESRYGIDQLQCDRVKHDAGVHWHENNEIYTEWK